MALFAFDHDDHLSAGGGFQENTPKGDSQLGNHDTAHNDDLFAKGTDGMELDAPVKTSSMALGTPPITIASPPIMRRMPSGTDTKIQAAPEKINFDALLTKSQKKKKKKRSMKPAAAAATTIRGFQTPVTSGGEESDVSMSVTSTPRLGPALSGLPSVTSSPALRPMSAASGISSLKQQLEALNIGSKLDSPSKKPSAFIAGSGLSSNTSMSGFDSDSDRTEMESYEVTVEHDFVSPDVPVESHSTQNGANVCTDSIARKMTAEDFEPLTCLGKGSFGTVVLVRQRATGRLYAQKQFKKASLTVRKKLIEQTKTERTILESINRHPFVVKLYYAFQDHEKLYLILEYAQGGELFHHLACERMFPEDTVAFYMAEMVLALDHLHRTVGVIYRDLKPENCLLDAEGHLLLTDFGLSKVALDDEPCKSFLGTIEYMAPEVIQGVDYGMAVDWWSLGALGFDLLTGSPPFTGNNHAKIQDKILKQKLQLPYYLGPDAKDLLTRLLRKEPKKRLGFNMPKDLQTIKSHRFFRKINWKKLEARELEPPIQPMITDPELAENFDTSFTELAVSPVATKKGFEEFFGAKSEDPFGGFSFVASSSLLEGGGWGY